MATANTPMPISAEAQSKVCVFLNSAIDLYSTSYNIRDQLLQRDLAYARTNDYTEENARAKAANQSGDPKKTQNIIIPVAMPQVESRLADLQEIFLSGHPIFATVAPPGHEKEMAQMDAVIEDNSIVGAWHNNILQTLRDGLKYDLGAAEIVWDNKKIYNIGTPTNREIEQGQPLESYYQGNFIKRLDPYNVILDTRVPPEENYTRGEFAGYTELVGRIELKKRMEDLDPMGSMNFRQAFESPGPGVDPSANINAPFYIPQINPDALLPIQNRMQHNWMEWVGEETRARNGGINYSNTYEWTVLYARILPSDFNMNVRNRNHVQIWKFIVINRHVVIFAERQTNAHNFLPILIAKPSNDSLAWQSKSFLENAMPFQAVATSLLNSGLESQRRKVYDRMLYDPTKVNKKDIDNVSSVARIPVKSSQYGKGLSDSVYQIPYRDDGVAEILNFSNQVIQMADIANGQNRVQQGQFQKGNKTRKEFDTVMSFASNRVRMMALGLEFTFFQPMKQIIKSNMLQFQPPTTITNPNDGTAVAIDPQALRTANLRFKLADGFLPAEKLVGMDTMTTLFNAAGALPQIAAEYDLMGILSYSLQLQGASWLQDFKRTPDQQKAYIQQMQQAATAAGTRNPPPAGSGAPSQQTNASGE